MSRRCCYRIRTIVRIQQLIIGIRMCVCGFVPIVFAKSRVYWSHLALAHWPKRAESILSLQQHKHSDDDTLVSSSSSSREQQQRQQQSHEFRILITFKFVKKFAIIMSIPNIGIPYSYQPYRPFLYGDIQTVIRQLLLLLLLLLSSSLPISEHPEN
jgi:hypothetical protein